MNGIRLLLPLGWLIFAGLLWEEASHFDTWYFLGWPSILLRVTFYLLIAKGLWMASNSLLTFEREAKAPKDKNSPWRS